MMYRKQLHPAAVLLYAGTYIKNILPLYMIVLFRFRYDLPFSLLWNTVILLAGFAGLVLLFSWVGWHCFTYRIEKGQICVESGIWLRKTRYISKERIQAIHELQDIGHRLFGLVKLQIETAGGNGEHEVVLSALTKDEAAWIQQELTVQREAAAGEKLYRLSPARLRLYAATSGGVGLVLSAVIGMYSELSDYMQLPFQLSFFYARSPLFYVWSFGLLLLAVWGVGFLLVYQKYYGFQIVRQRDELWMTRGLFEKKKIVIPLSRIQAVKIEENMMRQWLGFITVQVVSAGSREDQQERSSYVCFPLLRRHELQELMSVFLPNYTIYDELHRLPRKARSRYIGRLLLGAGAVSAGLLYFLPAAAYAVPAVLLAAVWLGVWQYRDAGWRVDGQQFTVSQRTLTRTTMLVKRQHVQAVSVRKTPWQEQAALCTVKLYVTSGALSADMVLWQTQEEVGEGLRLWYSYRPEIGLKRQVQLRQLHELKAREEEIQL